MGRLAGKVAVVTGGRSGLGRGTRGLLALEGARDGGGGLQDDLG